MLMILNFTSNSFTGCQLKIETRPLPPFYNEGGEGEVEWGCVEGRNTTKPYIHIHLLYIHSICIVCGLDSLTEGRGST